jgi:TRAP-type C4-dicarboxylate transport system permease small subunit
LAGDKVNSANGIEHQVADFSPREHPEPAPLPQGWIERLEKALAVFSKWATIIAGISLMGMLVISIADVIGNKIFNQPVQGASEYVSLLALITTAFALTYSMIEKAHVQVDLFISKLPRRLKAFIEGLVAFLNLGLFILLTWFSFRYGIQLQEANELSMTQRIPLSPFAFAIAFACLPACLYLFLEFLRWSRKVVSK